MSADKAIVEIWVGNQGWYAEGRLVDKMLSLPMDPAALDSWLDESGIRDPMHEEVYVSDYERWPYGRRSAYALGEWVDLHDINLLAEVARSHPDEAERVRQAIDLGLEPPRTTLGLLNLVAQAEDIPIHPYSCDDWYLDPSHGCSPEEKLGATIASGTPWWDALSDVQVGDVRTNLQDFFDLELFAQSFGPDVVAGEEAYLDRSAYGIDLDRYGREELAEMLGAFPSVAERSHELDEPAARHR